MKANGPTVWGDALIQEYYSHSDFKHWDDKLLNSDMVVVFDTSERKLPEMNKPKVSSESTSENLCSRIFLTGWMT